MVGVLMVFAALRCHGTKCRFFGNAAHDVKNQPEKGDVFCISHSIHV